MAPGPVDRARARLELDRPRQGLRELTAARDQLGAAITQLGAIARALAAGHMLSAAAGTTDHTRLAHAALDQAHQLLLTVDEYLADAAEAEMAPLRQGAASA